MNKKKNRLSRQFRKLTNEALEERRLLTIVPPGLSPGDQYVIAFATSEGTQPNFVGTSGGDEFVNQVVAATNSNVTCDIGDGCPNYTAILSDSGQDARDIPIPIGIPIYNTGGQLVANSYADLWLGNAVSLVNPITFDEAGQPVSRDMWTGTTSTGVHSISANDWTGGLGGTGVASNSVTGPAWIEGTPSNNATLPLYGISDVLRVDGNGDGDGSEVESIHGMKFEDIDGDGVYEPEDGDVGLNGWTIELIDGGGNVVSQVTHDGPDGKPGAYWFEDVTPGTYVIREVHQDGWVQTLSPGDVELLPGQVLEGVDFGNFELIDICGVKFEDLDGDGIQDEKEPLLDGWTIYLDVDENGEFDPGIDKSVETKNGGQYCFRDLGPGTYAVREVQQSGWEATQGANGYDIVALSGMDPNSGQCHGSKPKFDDDSSFTAAGQVAIATCFFGVDSNFVPAPSRHVLGVIDLNGINSSAKNTNLTPAMYHGPVGGEWTGENLGTIFGTALDDLGNIYVTATSSYNFDAYASGGSGGVYKIDRHSGAISVFAQLPQSTTRSGLGNIAFDPANRQLVVSNFEDGKLYLLDLGGSVIGTFDHQLPDDGAPGFAPLGERVWGVEVHNGRVYYAVWANDQGRKLANTPNEVWSAPIGAGTIGAATWEADVPDLGPNPFTVSDVSNPVADISFHPDGQMVLAERPMRADSLPAAHTGRVFEVDLIANSWQVNKYDIGIFDGNNSAGGVDVDFEVGGRLWATGDALKLQHDNEIYGIQGVPTSGGSVGNSLLIDLDGRLQSMFQPKTQIGDVEIPCPVGVNFGNQRLPHGSIHGEKWLDVDRDGMRDADEVGLAGVTVYVDADNSGDFDAGVDPHAVSMADGSYWIEEVPAGTWNVGEAPLPVPFAGYPNGLAQTFPANDGLHVVNVEPGLVIEGILFGNGPAPGGIGNARPGSIHGIKWNDLDGDGEYEPNDGETPMQGVEIYADLNDNGKHDPDEPITTTMADGMYWLEGLPPGEVIVREVEPDGWLQTYPVPSSQTGFTSIRIGDADGFGYADGATHKNTAGNSVNVDKVGTLAAGDYLPDRDLNGSVDVNQGDDFDHRLAIEKSGNSVMGNGFVDLGTTGSEYTDVALSDVVSAEFPPSGPPVLLAAVGAPQPGFAFNFSVAPTDVVAGKPLFFNTVIGDFDAPVTAQIRVTNQGSSTNYDLSASSNSEDGLIQSATATIPFYDLFTMQGGEYVANVTIDVLMPLEEYVAYDYAEIATTAAFAVPTTAGHTVKLKSGESREGFDFGNVRACSGHGQKFEDINGNGAYDPGEPGIQGVTVYWDRNMNEQIDDDEPSTQTMDDGMFWLEGLPPGKHVIREIVPDGYIPTADGFVVIEIDPDNPEQCEVPEPIGGIGDVGVVGPNDDRIALDLVANDIQRGSDPVVPVILSEPANGSLELTMEGLVVYQPDPGFSGIDEFEYQPVGWGNSGESTTVSLQVISENIPSAESVFVEAVVGEATVIDVPIPDSAVALSARLLPTETFGPGGGTVEQISDFAFRYEPGEGFSGTDFFSYTITDSEGNIGESAGVIIGVSEFAAPLNPAVVDAALSVLSPGDVDGDGDVSFTDFLILSQNFGRSDALVGDGDLDGDGDVGFSDFLILSQNFSR